MTQVSYKDATSNLSSWMPNSITPNWVKTPTIDGWVFLISVLIIIVVSVFYHRVYILSLIKKSFSVFFFSKRVPLNTIIKEVKEGWICRDNKSLYEPMRKFFNLLRQAGVDSKLNFYGRNKADPNSPIVNIPTEHWKDNGFNIETLDIVNLLYKENPEDKTCVENTFSTNEFKDIYVDEKQIKKWLKRKNDNT